MCQKLKNVVDCFAIFCRHVVLYCKLDQHIMGFHFGWLKEYMLPKRQKRKLAKQTLTQTNIFNRIYLEARDRPGTLVKWHHKDR